MALTRATKTEKVRQARSRARALNLRDYRHLQGRSPPSKDFELRKTVREAGGSYHVVKNKLAARAAEGTKIEAALRASRASRRSPTPRAIRLRWPRPCPTWVKDNAEFTFKLGIVDGKVITVAEISELATMPGKEELFSKLLFLIHSPAQRLATVINATGRDLAVVINQGVEKGKFAGPQPQLPAATRRELQQPSQGRGSRSRGQG